MMSPKPANREKTPGRRPCQDDGQDTVSTYQNAARGGSAGRRFFQRITVLHLVKSFHQMGVGGATSISHAIRLALCRWRSWFLQRKMSVGEAAQPVGSKSTTLNIRTLAGIIARYSFFSRMAFGLNSCCRRFGEDRGEYGCPRSPHPPSQPPSHPVKITEVAPLCVEKRPRSLMTFGG